MLRLRVRWWDDGGCIPTCRCSSLEIMWMTLPFDVSLLQQSVSSARAWEKLQKMFTQLRNLIVDVEHYYVYIVYIVSVLFVPSSSSLYHHYKFTKRRVWKLAVGINKLTATTARCMESFKSWLTFQNGFFYWVANKSPCIETRRWYLFCSLRDWDSRNVSSISWSSL